MSEGIIAINSFQIAQFPIKCLSSSELKGVRSQRDPIHKSMIFLLLAHSLVLLSQRLSLTVRNWRSWGPILVVGMEAGNLSAICPYTFSLPSKLPILEIMFSESSSSCPSRPSGCAIGRKFTKLHIQFFKTKYGMDSREKDYIWCLIIIVVDNQFDLRINFPCECWQINCESNYYSLYNF